MLKGAAKTATENEAQIHPKTFILFEPFRRNCIRTTRIENTPTFKEMTTLRVCFCSPENS